MSVDSAATASAITAGLIALADRLTTLRERRVFLTTGDFSRDLGVLTGVDDESARRHAAQLSRSGIDTPLLERVVGALMAGAATDLVVRMDALAGIVSSFDDPAAAELDELWPHVGLSLYGTDGCRGEVSSDTPGSAEALRLKLADQLMTPALFRDLVRATILALRDGGLAVEAALVGWDTRDLFADSPEAGRFHRALTTGVTSTGCKALVSGVTPIGQTACLLARFADRPGLTLGFNKTASHNPPSHDGLKTFLLEPTDAGAPRCRKLRPAEERRITARVFAEAMADPRATGEAGQTTETGLSPADLTRIHDISAESEDVFRSIVTRRATLGLEGEDRWRAAAVVYDGSNGAAGTPERAETLRAAFGLAVEDDAAVELTACEPNGRNINDRCGAGLFEGLDLLPVDEALRRFGEVRSVVRVSELGRERRAASREDGRLVYGLATDGDSDRSYVFFYDPFVDGLRFIDGDAAIHLSITDLLARGRLGPGDRVAFTIESLAGFCEDVLVKLREGLGADQVVLRRFDDPPREDRLEVVLTPVGDKWILETAPAVGGESTGHLIRSVPVPDATVMPSVHAGHGPIALFTTVSALERRFATARAAGRFEESLARVARPWPSGLTLTTYVYFVDRPRFYRGGPVWRELAETILELAGRHMPDFDLRVVEGFEADPNTWLLLVEEDGRLVLSLHVRCSGTEAKIGLKASAVARPEPAGLLDALDDVVFARLLELLADRRSPYLDWQRTVLAGLAEGPRDREALTADLKPAEGDDARLFEGRLETLRGAMLKQRLLRAEHGGLFAITPRGREVLATLSES